MKYITIAILNVGTSDPLTLLMCLGCGSVVPAAAKDVHDSVIHEYAR